MKLKSINCSCSPIARSRKFQEQMIEDAIRWQEEYYPGEEENRIYAIVFEFFLRIIVRALVKRKHKYIKMTHND